MTTYKITQHVAGLSRVLPDCGSRKYPYPHHRGSMEILRWRGVLKAKILKQKYEPKLEFPEGWVAQTKKTPPWGEYRYFLTENLQSVS